MSEHGEAALKIVFSKPVSLFGALGGGLVFTLSTAGLGLLYLALSGESSDQSELMVLAIFVASYLLFTLVSGLIGCLSGVRRLLRPEVQASGPEPLRDYQGALIGALVQGKLDFFGSLSSRLRVLFGKNIAFLPPIAKKIVQRNGNAVLWRAFKLPILALVIVILLYKLPGETSVLPLIALLAAGVVHAVTEYVSARALVPSRPPVARADHSTQYYKGFGHPTHLFSRLPICAAQLALPGFVNRIYRWGDMERSGVVQDTGEFAATVFIERQPEVLRTESSVVGVWLLGVGWVWRIVAVGILAVVPLYFGPLLASSLLAGLLILGVAARLFYKGGVYKQEGVDLLDALRFKSVGVLINFQGEISRSSVKVGVSSLDSISSENLSTRSNFTAQFAAAEMITEARDIEDRRYLLELRQSESSQEWIRCLQSEIAQLREERIRPVGVELTSAESMELADANLRILAEQSGTLRRSGEADRVPAQSIPELLPARAQPDRVPDLPSPADFKVCPDCAERVRAAANRCRFCGYRFDASEALPPEDASLEMETPVSE